MMIMPDNTHSFDIRLHPDESALNDFDAWREQQKARLEAAGLAVTGIKGACFSGYYHPDHVDRSVFDDHES